MSNITSQKNYIQVEGARSRSPVSESLMQTIGGSINWLLDGLSNKEFKTAEFLTNGTWTCPDGVTKIMLLGCGGGGGGCAVSTSGTSYLYANVPGGEGGKISPYFLSVTPGIVYQITIGAGGGAASASGAVSYGGTGGSTLFKDNTSTVLATFVGGKGGGAYVVGTSGVLGGNLIFATNQFNDNSSGFSSGANYDSFGSKILGGAAGPYGAGGNAGFGGNGASAGSNTGAGGGGALVTSGSVSSGAGGSGRLTIVYV